MHLLEAVRQTVTFAPWAAVVYYDPDRPLHGSLVLAGENVRRRYEPAARAATDGDDWARLALWNPAEWLSGDSADAHEISFDDLAADLSDLIADYETTRAGHDDADGDEAAVRLIRRIAKRLYADLPQAVDVATDFVAYPLDLELTELPKGLKATVPRDVFTTYTDVLP